ncbi:hypothetical protein LY76DRAFT_383604 [Colletotrichum caudatum]|nr:hypothetical protein LY76DRAFT_383604 [Colletotrichum caudatum]
MPAVRMALVFLSRAQRGEHAPHHTQQSVCSPYCSLPVSVPCTYILRNSLCITINYFILFFCLCASRKSSSRDSALFTMW